MLITLGPTLIQLMLKLRSSNGCGIIRNKLLSLLLTVRYMYYYDSVNTRTPPRILIPCANAFLLAEAGVEMLHAALILIALPSGPYDGGVITLTPSAFA